MKIEKEMLKSLVRALVIFLACLGGAILLWIISKIVGAYWVYGLYLGKVISLFGLDIVFSRMIAALLTMLTLLFAPWVAFHYFLGTRKRELSLVSVVLIIGGALIIYHGSANVFFDRATGQPVKYYVKTLDGFRFSNAPDFDPKFGVKYKPIDAEIIKDYYFWGKNGRYSNLPGVIKGKYFDITTGEPIVWYAERAEGTRELFPLPGYDPLTGKVLKPMTAEIAEAIVSAAKEQEVKPQSSYGWVMNNAGELVANLQPGEETTRPFILQDGQSTPWVVIPPGNYDFRFTNLQTVIVEWNGQSRVVNPNDYLDLGKFGQKRVRLTALKGGAQISLNIKRRLQISS